MFTDPDYGVDQFDQVTQGSFHSELASRQYLNSPHMWKELKCMDSLHLQSDTSEWTCLDLNDGEPTATDGSTTASGCIRMEQIRIGME